MVVVCIEVNVVRALRLYPRSLLTPFTDEVELTRPMRTPTPAQANAQRAKGFQHVDVTFEPEDQA